MKLERPPVTTRDCSPSFHFASKKLSLDQFVPVSAVPRLPWRTCECINVSNHAINASLVVNGNMDKKGCWNRESLSLLIGMMVIQVLGRGGWMMKRVLA